MAVLCEGNLSPLHSFCFAFFYQSKSDIGGCVWGNVCLCSFPKIVRVIFFDKYHIWPGVASILFSRGLTLCFSAQRQLESKHWNLSFVRFSHSPFVQPFRVVRLCTFGQLSKPIVFCLQTSDCTNFGQLLSIFIYSKYLYHVQFTLPNKLAKAQKTCTDSVGLVQIQNWLPVFPILEEATLQQLNSSKGTITFRWTRPIILAFILHFKIWQLVTDIFKLYALPPGTLLEFWFHFKKNFTKLHFCTFIGPFRHHLTLYHPNS